MACTQEEARELEAKYKEYKDTKYVCVNWTLQGSDVQFEALSHKLYMLARVKHANIDLWADARDKRFEMLVSSMAECRKFGVFSADTLLVVSGADPSDDIELLGMKGVAALNPPGIVDQFACLMGFEDYRKGAPHPGG